LADSINDAAMAGWEYEQQMDRINDLEFASLSRVAKLKKEIEELTVASKNRNLGYKEQTRLAELAMKKEIELNGIETGYSKEKTKTELANLASKIQNDKLSTLSKQKQLEMWLSFDDLQLESALENSKTFSDFYDKNSDEFQELQKLRASDIDKETQLVTETRRLQTSLFTFKKSLLDEEKADREKEKAEKNKQLDFEAKLAEEELKIWADQINKKYELGLKEIEIEAAIVRELAKVRDKGRSDEQAKADKETNDLQDRIKKINGENAKNEFGVDSPEKQAQREELKQKSIESAIDLGNILFDMKTSQLQREFEMAEGNAEKQKEISKKLAQQEKKKALFDIGINTARAVMASLAKVPLPFGAPLMWLNIGMGAIQAAAVAAKPIPAFAKGTDYAPGGAAIVGEKGRELIQTPGGKVFLANNPALINLERGSKVLTNKQTEAYLNDGNIVSELRQTRKAIQQIPQPIFKGNSKIAERRGNYWVNYINQKHLRN